MYAPRSYLIVCILLSGMMLGTAPGPSAAQFTFTRVAATGDPAPDRPGASFGLFNGLALGNEGTLALVGETAFNHGGVWVTRPEGLRELTKSSFNEMIFVRDDGKPVRANAAEIVLYDGTTPVTIAGIELPAPGLPGTTFRQLLEVTFNPNGNLLFGARTNPPSSGVEGLWAYRGGSVELIAYSGQAAPVWLC